MVKPKGTINDIIIAGGIEKGLHEWQQDMKSTTELLEFFTNEGDIVLDPMCGAGTTLLACKKTNRRCIGIDISSEEVEISKGRLTEDILIQGKLSEM